MKVQWVRLATFAMGMSWVLVSGELTASADAKRHYIERVLQHEIQGFIPMDLSAVQEGWFDQRVDSTDPKDQRTFRQRYFINSEYAEGPQSPVFYMICGEGACEASSLLGAIREHAQAYKGHLVALEHRYYGKSIPVPDFSTKNLQYLSVAHALADLSSFQEFVQSQLGLKGKWIAVGGSYAGALSAFYRALYPSKVAGALASSGPVQALANFEGYDLHVAKVAGEECAKAMREVVVQVEKALAKPDTAAAIKAQFDASDVREEVDFLYVVADMAAFAVQYGMRDEFCLALTSGTDKIESYARIGKQMFARFGMTAVQDSFQGAESIDPKVYEEGVGLRAWMYQSCTEFGYYQTAYHDPKISVRSSRITLPYHDEVCNRLFGIPKPVDTARTNRLYYDQVQNPAVTSNVYLTNGSNDPWSLLSITHELGNDGLNSKLTVETIAGAAHCDDLRARGGSEVQKAKKKLQDLLKIWL